MTTPRMIGAQPKRPANPQGFVQTRRRKLLSVDKIKSAAQASLDRRGAASAQSSFERDMNKQ